MLQRKNKVEKGAREYNVGEVSYFKQSLQGVLNDKVPFEQ